MYCFIKLVAPTYLGLQLAPIDNTTLYKTKKQNQKQVTNKTHTVRCGKGNMRSHRDQGKQRRWWFRIYVSHLGQVHLLKSANTNASVYQLEASLLSTSSNIAYWLPSTRKVLHISKDHTGRLGGGTYWNMSNLT